MLLSNSRLRSFVLRALCASVVLFRNPRGLAIRLTRSILTGIALHSSPGRSWRARRHWRPGESVQTLGAVGCKAAIFEDGSTWTGSKRMAGSKSGKGEHFGVRDYSSPQTHSTCLNRDRWRQEHEVSKDDRRAAKLVRNIFNCISFQDMPKRSFMARISACTDLNCVAYPGWISSLMPLISSWI